MKRIQHAQGVEPMNTQSPYSAHKLYRVHLGNGRTLLFSTRRDAMSYMAETNRWLRDLLLECNTLHAEAYAEHRAAWPLYAEARNPKMAALDLATRELLQQAAHSMDRAAARHRELHFPWKAVEHALHATAEAFGALETWWKYKTQGVARWRCAMRQRQCLHALERMQQRGQAPPYGAVLTAAPAY